MFSLTDVHIYEMIPFTRFLQDVGAIIPRERRLK